MTNIYHLTNTDQEECRALRPGRDFAPFILYLAGDRTSSTFTGTVSNSLSFGTQSVIALFSFTVTFGTFNVCGVDGEYTQLIVFMDDAVTATIPPLPLRRNANAAAVIGTNVYYYDIFEDNAGDKTQLIEGFLESVDVVGT